MNRISRSALVHFSAEQMFELVDDIDSYQSFVPFCKDSKILSRSENEVTAKLLVAKSGIAKSFTTCNRLDKPNTIVLSLVDGPFSSLNGRWTFTELSDDACKIELNLEFKFSNKLATLAFAKIFNLLVESMISAFTKRAQELYHERSAQ